MKHLYLEQVQADGRVFYRVKKAVNSTCFRIGEKLSEPRVSSLCYDANWTVTITDGGI